MARKKTGDATRRYVGAVRTNGSGQIYNFTAEGDGNQLFVTYLEGTAAAPFNVLAAGTATTQTSVTLAAVVPLTSRMARVRLKNNATGGTARIRPQGMTANWLSLAAGELALVEVPLSATQTFEYIYVTTPTGGGLDADVMAYTDRR